MIITHNTANEVVGRWVNFVLLVIWEKVYVTELGNLTVVRKITSCKLSGTHSKSLDNPMSPFNPLSLKSWSELSKLLALPGPEQHLSSRSRGISRCNELEFCESWRIRSWRGIRSERGVGSSPFLCLPLFRPFPIAVGDRSSTGVCAVSFSVLVTEVVTVVASLEVGERGSYRPALHSAIVALLFWAGDGPRAEAGESSSSGVELIRMLLAVYSTIFIFPLVNVMIRNAKSSWSYFLLLACGPEFVTAPTFIEWRV